MKKADARPTQLPLTPMVRLYLVPLRWDYVTFESDSNAQNLSDWLRQQSAGSYASGGPPLFDRKIAGTNLSNKFESLDQILWLIDSLLAQTMREEVPAWPVAPVKRASPTFLATQLNENKSPKNDFFFNFSKCRKESYLVNIQIYAPHKFEFEFRVESRRSHMVPPPEFGHWQGAHDECQGASRAWGTEDGRRSAATQLIWDLSALLLLVSVPRALHYVELTTRLFVDWLLTYWLARARRSPRLPDTNIGGGA